jgi:predicted NAD-dependent protein-ADP-ribosyltransferase YbiA (DUF1768 family)
MKRVNIGRYVRNLEIRQKRIKEDMKSKRLIFWAEKDSSAAFSNVIESLMIIY